MKHKWILGIAAAVVVLLVGLSWLNNDREYRRALAETDRLEAYCRAQGSSHAAFLNTVEKKTVPYRNPLSESLIAGEKRIREGLDQAQVRQILGQPSYVEAYRDKDGVGFNGCDWIYLIDGRFDGDILQEEDLVSVFFDGSSRVSVSFRKKQE